MHSKKYIKPFSSFLKKEESKVFFLRGFQRSGTNWLCNILNLHPKINCVGEFHLGAFATAYKRITDKRFGLLATKIEIFEKNYSSFIKNTIMDYADNYPICGDRSPQPLDALILPNHKYILITRDGRDCIVSWIYHCLRRKIVINENFDKKIQEFEKEEDFFEINKQLLLQNKGILQGLATKWNNRIVSDFETMKNAENLGIQVYHVKYNELISKTEEIRKELYDFLELDYKAAAQLNDLTTPGFEKHNPNSHYRKGESGRWKLYFTEKQHNAFLDKASQACNLLNLNKNFK